MSEPVGSSERFVPEVPAQGILWWELETTGSANA